MSPTPQTRTTNGDAVRVKPAAFGRRYKMSRRPMFYVNMQNVQTHLQVNPSAATATCHRLQGQVVLRRSNPGSALLPAIPCSRSTRRPGRCLLLCTLLASTILPSVSSIFTRIQTLSTTVMVGIFSFSQSSVSHPLSVILSLTFPGILAASVTFVFGFLADVSRSNFLFTCKNISLLIAAPVQPISCHWQSADVPQLEALVTLLFWPIYLYDPTLLVDPTVAPQLPLSIELAFHFFPTLFLMIDTLLFSPPWETHALAALSVFSVVGSGYWIWVERCYSYNNFYPYPLLDIMTQEHRLLLFCFATLLCWSSFLVVRALYHILNGKLEKGVGNGKKND